MNFNISSRNRYLLPATICFVVVIFTFAFYFFMPMSVKSDKQYLLIDDDDTVDSVYNKLEPISHGYSLTAFRILSRHLHYEDRIRTGLYAVESGAMPLTVFRRLRNGQQEPVKLVVPSVRTVDRLAEELSKHLMMSSDSLLYMLQDNDICKSYGLDTATVQCMFIPNTYEVYWDITPKKLLDRMNRESEAFWTNERRVKANNIGLSKVEVVTLASIVDEETSNNEEKPMIAGMYINRLKTGMPLQADPTIKYALKQFELRRIYTKLLSVDSPYNTYRNVGLPPGPIRIPSVAGIDAVLNRIPHDYMYMCAKEDFSGTHNFARTYAEHLANAHKYSAALNARGIE